MVKYYPVFINLEKIKCLVIGGGKVAERKIKTLLTHGAEIKVISPCVTEAIEKIAKQNKVKLAKRAYRKSDIKSVQLVIIATEDASLNSKIADEARKANILVNTVSSVNSNFIMPAIVSKGALKIAVSTSGASPALVKKIKNKLKKEFSKDYIDYINFLGKIRQKILKEINNKNERNFLMNKIASNEIIKLVENNNSLLWKEKIRNVLQEKGLKIT
ncbi:MAG: bifunctional precorrin-2 dehydrogenase/sirohydrochlorin ferrochelatase [Candidatus Firestonebacteria bacterium]|nr:bifunctional precorrin-2 dehydrogenase/sirohydrochlorin ferrochelatase [Candidatus Firestonebacteria bacterium]